MATPLAFLLSQTYSSLGTHRFRTFLTTLGIIFGVAAVIAMMSIGEGARREALALIESLGARNVLVLSERLSLQQLMQQEEQTSRYQGLGMADLEVLGRELSGLGTVSPVVGVSQRYVRGSRGEANQLVVLGVEPEYLQTLGLRLARGRLFDVLDEERAERTCVLGDRARLRLLGDVPGVGERIKVEDQWLTVIGVLASREQKSAAVEGVEGQDASATIYVPARTARLRFAPPPDQPGELSQIVVTARDPEQVVEVASLVRRILGRLHGAVQDYRVVVPEELLRQKQEAQRIFNWVMGCIASISLLVGGIGIMNIMLASVLERTAEIGLRRAVGATKADILGQFLAEAVAICLVGGALGLLVGIGLSWLIAALAGWSTAISLLSLALSIGVSGAVGILFGYFPARQAARLNVIDALRYE